MNNSLLPCLEPGCPEPRAVSASGNPYARCHMHESVRRRAYWADPAHRAAQAAAQRRYFAKPENRAAYNAASLRAYYKRVGSAEGRAACNARQRAYRANPAHLDVREAHNETNRRWLAIPANRESRNAASRSYRADPVHREAYRRYRADPANRDAKRAAERARRSTPEGRAAWHAAAYKAKRKRREAPFAYSPVGMTTNELRDQLPDLRCESPLVGVSACGGRMQVGHEPPVVWMTTNFVRDGVPLPHPHRLVLRPECQWHNSAKGSRPDWELLAFTA